MAQRVYLTNDTLLIRALCERLDRSGICASVQNAAPPPGNEFPLVESWVELWILRDAQLVEAKGVIEQYLVDDPSVPSPIPQSFDAELSPRFRIA